MRTCVATSWLLESFPGGQRQPEAFAGATFPELPKPIEEPYPSFPLSVRKPFRTSESRDYGQSQLAKQTPAKPNGAQGSVAYMGYGVGC